MINIFTNMEDERMPNIFATIAEEVVETVLKDGQGEEGTFPNVDFLIIPSPDEEPDVVESFIDEIVTGGVDERLIAFRQGPKGEPLYYVVSFCEE